MKKLLWYLLILAVFLLAYGVSIQAIMHTEREWNTNIFRKIVDIPYWHIYGELSLDDLEGKRQNRSSAYL